MSNELLLSHNINFLLQVRGMNVNQLSRVTGILSTSIHKLKDGLITNPTIGTIIPIAKYFGITVEKLCTTKLTNDIEGPLIDVKIVPLISLDDIESYQTSDIKKFIPIDNKTGNNVVCIHAPKGNILFENSSILIVDKAAEQVNDSYVIVKNIINLNFSIKRLIVDDDEKVLKSVVDGLDNKYFNYLDYSILGRILGYYKFF